MEYLSTEQISTVRHHLTLSRNIAITVHNNPDGDAIGAGLALFHYLHEQGHHARLISPNGYPNFLHWMPSDDLVVQYDKNKEKAQRYMEEAEIVFVVDYNSPERSGEVEESLKKSKAFKIMIDHHPMPADDFVDIKFSKLSASSSAELVYDFISTISGQGAVSRNAAECIFAGIVSDTGSFSHNSSHPRLFEIVADLMRIGVRKDFVIDQMFKNFTEDRMRLMGYVLNEKMEVNHDLHSSVITLTIEEQRKFNFQKGDSEGLVNMPLSISDVVLSIFLFETPEYVKLSLRSKGNFDVNKLAREYFQGGGHKNAAGGRFYKSIQEAAEAVKSLLPKYAEQLKETATL